MSGAATTTQDEPRNISAGCKVTQSEKAALELVAMVDVTSESNLLRDRTLAQVMERAEEIRADLERAKQARKAS